MERKKRGAETDYESVCRVYEVLIPRIMETVERSGKDTFEGLKAVICYQPYSLRQNVMLSN